MIKWNFKDPDEVLDYEVDWTARIGTDNISSAVWTSSPAGLTIDSSQIVGKLTVVWLSDGILETEYAVECLLTTSGGRIHNQTFVLPIRTR